MRGWSWLAVGILAVGYVAMSNNPIGHAQASTTGLVTADSILTLQGICPCEPTSVEVSVPADFDESGWLELLVRWDGTAAAGIRPLVTDPSGAAQEAQRGFDSFRTQVWDPLPGTYTIAFDGAGAYAASLRLLERGGQRQGGTQRLPDLVTLVPSDVRIGSCDYVETLEQNAGKCLRLGNGIGNVGEGPLEVKLTYERGVKALADKGRFVQRILKEGGGATERDVGMADFHVAHGHWHYSGIAGFSLHAYDAATGLRGAEVAAHHKAGFCLLDIDRLNEPDANPAPNSEHAEQDCLVPWTSGWTMGVSSGWYDFYGSGLTDQYVDIEGVADGTYELVSAANSAGTLIEEDPTNNAASVLLELKAGKVNILEKRGYYQVR